MDSPSGPIDRYLKVLEIVAASKDGLKLTEIQELSGLPKPTVHRLTKSLVEAGALTAEDTRYKTYRIGSRMWRMLHLGLSHDVVKNHAQFIVDELSSKLCETCYVVRLCDKKVSSIARSVPDQGHRLHVLPGESLPIHVAASSKAILAYQPEGFVNSILREPLEKITCKTKNNIKDIMDDLSKIRNIGYSVCDRELDENIMAFAVPVHLKNAGVIYSIGVTGPYNRMSSFPEAHWVTPLGQAATKLSMVLENVAAEDSITN